jgi:LPS export ABC transporter protein LptC
MKSMNKKTCRFVLFSVLGALFFSCSFNYDTSPEEDKSQPDIIMRDVEYVRIRSGDPVARFQAESAERYEDRQTMNLSNFSFDQFESHGTEINASGSARDASVELDSGNIRMNGDVRIAVDSEDITIETSGLEWRDKERLLSANPDAPVEIFRSDGTRFAGVGFSADTRSRTWEFSGGVGGSYIDEDEDEEEEENTPVSTGDGEPEGGSMEDQDTEDEVMETGEPLFSGGFEDK